MQKLLKFLFGTAERKVVTAVVVLFSVVYFAPSLGNVQVGLNENLAAQSDADYCHNRYQNLASRCNADPKCNWPDNTTKCTAKGSGRDSSTVSITPSCNGTTPTATISWPTKGETNHWIDIATNPQFKNLSNKNPQGSSSTIAPDGFSNSLTLNSGTKYYVRVYYPSTGERIPASFTALKCGGRGAPTATPTPLLNKDILLSSLREIQINGRTVQDGSCSYDSGYDRSTRDYPVENGTGIFQIVLRQNFGNNNFDVSAGSANIGRSLYYMDCVKKNTCDNYSFSSNDLLENFHPNMGDVTLYDDWTFQTPTATYFNQYWGDYYRIDLLSLKLAARQQGTWESYNLYYDDMAPGWKSAHVCTSRWIIDSVKGIK